MSRGFRKVLAQTKCSGFQRISLLALVKCLSICKPERLHQDWIQCGNIKVPVTKEKHFPATHAHQAQQWWLLNEKHYWAQEAPLQLTSCPNPVHCFLMPRVISTAVPGSIVLQRGLFGQFYLRFQSLNDSLFCLLYCLCNSPSQFHHWCCEQRPPTF